MAGLPEMQILCGQCGKTMHIDPGYEALAVSCIHCGRDIDLLSLDAENAPQWGPDDTIPLEDEEALTFDAIARDMMKRSSTIQVECGSCRKTLSVSVRKSGRKARCPGCDASIRIPYPDDDYDYVPARGIDSSTAGASGNISIAAVADDVKKTSKANVKNRGFYLRISPTVVILAFITVLMAMVITLAIVLSNGTK